MKNKILPTVNFVYMLLNCDQLYENTIKKVWFKPANLIFFLETIATQGTVQQIAKPRPPNENIQPKQQVNRPLNILPSSTANIRPASSVSTQTIGAQTPVSKNNELLLMDH